MFIIVKTQQPTAKTTITTMKIENHQFNLTQGHWVSIASICSNFAGHMVDLLKWENGNF